MGNPQLSSSSNKKFTQDNIFLGAGGIRPGYCFGRIKFFPKKSSLITNIPSSSLGILASINDFNLL